MSHISKLTISLCCILAIAGCDDDKSNAREIIFTDDIADIEGSWFLSDSAASFNPDGQNYKNTNYSETIFLTASSQTRGVLSFCEKDDIDVELKKNTLYQVIESPLDEDNDGIQDMDNMGNPLTEEVFIQLFVLNNIDTMLQNYIFSCDTDEEVNELRCAQGEYAVGRTNIRKLANNNFGSITINEFSTSSYTEIGTGNPQTLDISCFTINQEAETDGEGLTEVVVKAANNDYSITSAYENQIDYDTALLDFTQTNIAWVEKLESAVSGITWTYKDAEANAPLAEQFRAKDTGTFSLAINTANLTTDVILSDGNKIEEDNGGVTSTVGYSVNADTNLTFELPVSTE